VFPFYDNPIVGVGWLAGRLTALNVMGKYVVLLAWPWRLSSDYSWAQILPARGDWLAWIALAGLADCGGLAVARRTRGLVRGGRALLVFSADVESAVRDRHDHGGALFIPAAIAFVAAVLGGGRDVGERKATAAMALCGSTLGGRDMGAESGLAGRFGHRSRAAVSASPDSFKAHKMLAFALHEGGGANLAQAIEEARQGVSSPEGSG
jgi:hypothetical protein